MKELLSLDGLSHEEKDALIRAQWKELQKLRAEMEKFKRKRVKKTSRNSSLPPTQDFRANRCHQGKTNTRREVSAIYERIELPLIQPIVTWVEHYGGTCCCCRQDCASPMPVSLEPGSPYSHSVASVVTYLRYSYAGSYQHTSTSGNSWQSYTG